MKPLSIFKSAVAAAAMGLALPAGADGYRPSQLERQTVSPEEYGRYSVHTLAQIKFAQDDPKLNPTELRHRVELIKQGIAGRFSIGLGRGGLRR